MIETNNLIFIHGLYGSSQGVKAGLLRGLFPGILTPDFKGSLDERMTQLVDILGNRKIWTLIGSSFGGLMASIFTCEQHHRVNKLVLLAPALIWPDFAQKPPGPVQVPTIIFHGTQDTVIPLSAVKPLAERVFENLTFYTVEDDHGLYNTVHAIDWPQLLGGSA
jgi:pimeloyl-ACP methyl ester carboxylesterase